MLHTRLDRVLVIALFLFSGCGTIIPNTKPGTEHPPQESRVELESAAGESREAGSPLDESDQAESLAHKPFSPSKDNLSYSPYKDEEPSDRRSASCGTDRPPFSRNGPVSKDQEWIDTALDLLQASNDYWEQGDVDAAINTLDKAYSLILRVDEEESPDLVQQKEDLRFTISKRILEAYASRFRVANGSHNAIPLVMNRHVERALDLFKGKERDFFLSAYQRSGRYRPAILKTLREAGLPEEISWLPLIESGFKVRAFSRARALGLWQFIASTGYKFGLKRDRWIDERMDPEKSTKAAIAYLKELHHMFGDWTTALAAYNCGEYAVLKRIRTQRINYLDNFWDLYEKLPRETAFYVPQFLAVLHILNDPEAHGMTLPPLEEPVETEGVTISRQVHLKNIADLIGVEEKTLQELNAALRRNVTPDSPYEIAVPLGKGDLLLAKLDDIPAWRKPVPTYYVHRVRSGENLSTIACKYRTSVRAIMAMNGLRDKDFLRVGARLRVPMNGRRVSSLETPPRQSDGLKGKVLTYEVRKGDSLWKIAGRHNTTTKMIVSLNQLRSTRLRVGQVLKVPAWSTTSKPVQTRTYRVKKGDSPYLVARRHQMDLSEFLSLNKLTPRSTIFPGQELLIRAD
ncbi:MAG: LysM peptidoglycan-binding domain-containing protein [Deltaproteobacteria bacterium]|nr:LysM peptidoglycan-binding domain-containing protein [Deltaproteobacteria bacterium]